MVEININIANTLFSMLIDRLETFSRTKTNSCFYLHLLCSHLYGTNEIDNAA